MMSKGLFGKRLPGQMPWNTPGIGDGLPQGPMETRPMAGEITIDPNWQSRGPMKQPGFWQGGNKFTVRDGIAGALAAIGDGLSNWAGGGGGAVQGLMGGREQAAAIAAQQRAQAERLAAAQRLGYTPDQIAILGGELGKVQAERMGPDQGAKPGSFEWYQTATPEQRALYDQYNPVIATTWQGPTPIPRSRLGGGLPTAPVGKLTPVQPTIENTPAPQLNANGMPSALTRAQYQAVEERMGKAATEAWARRNNIRVVN